MKLFKCWNFCICSLHRPILRDLDFAALHVDTIYHIQIRPFDWRLYKTNKMIATSAAARTLLLRSSAASSRTAAPAVASTLAAAGSSTTTTRNFATTEPYSDYGKSVFTGRVADEYLKKHGASGALLKDPAWTSTASDTVAKAVLDW